MASLRGAMTSSATATVRVPRRCSSKADPAHPVYEIDLWLIDSEPPIWRSLAVPAEFTLGELHELIQVVMDWEDAHLHRFETKGGRLFEPATQVGGVDSMWDWIRGNRRKGEHEARVTLRSIFEDLTQKILYTYDFGDNWEHGIKLVDTHEDRSAFASLPCCLAGGRAGPPEDSGGPWGYQEKLEILRNPDPHVEWHQDVIEWMGERPIDPEAFDLADRNRRIARIWQRQPVRSSSKGRRRNQAPEAEEPLRAEAGFRGAASHLDPPAGLGCPMRFRRVLRLPPSPL